MRDIQTPDDCHDLISYFYDKLLADKEIGHFFYDLSLDSHISRVSGFWAFILLDEAGYKGNMMEAHAHLNLKDSDFNRWLELFHETVREHFKGEKADLAIQRSSLIAMTMRAKFT
jgi:hemoglobin